MNRTRYYHTKRRKPLWLPIVIILLLILAGLFLYRNMHIASVRGFSAETVTQATQTLTWNTSKKADRYELFGVNGEQKSALGTVSADSETKYTMEKLKSGTLYSYEIVAVHSFLGKEYRSKPARLSVYSAPDNVQNASASTQSKNSLTLKWNAVENAKGYEISYNKKGGEAKTAEAEQCEFTVKDLKEGEQYEFRVRAFVADTERKTYSSWSPPITAKVTKAVDMTGIDVKKPMVAITFDDGPDYGKVTTRILDTLKKYNGHATFFQLGNRAAELPKLMARIADEGHEIGCHTYDHTHYGKKVTSEDITRGNDAIQKTAGSAPTAFRSPGGMTTDTIRKACVAEGMPIYYWSLDTRDWESRNADAVCKQVMGHVSDGDIILMHNIYASTADAVERVIPYLVQQGYQLVTVSQLVQAKTGQPPVPGTQYYTATHTN